MKSKQIISLSAAALMALSIAAFAGCEPENKPDEKPEDKTVQLSAPAITLTDNVISWNAVEHADSYIVKESTTTVSTQTELSYTIDKTEAGEYTYTVTATSTDKKYSASSASNTVTYKVEVKPDVPKFEGKIYLVGDSTVCAFNDNYYMPRYGYGTQLYNYLDCKEDQIVNLALSGRSSLSFTYGLDVDDKNKNELTGELSCYEYFTQNIAAGDYLIIGFGHNDEKNEAARFTNPTKTHTDASTENGPSFQYILNEKYIKVAKDKGATPILCTPVVRYNANPDKYNEANGHITADGDYPEAIRTLGKETGTTVIDLTQITKDDYIDKGAEALNYHAHTTYSEPEEGSKTPAGADTTHLNYYGAKMVAYELATAIKASNCSLKDLVKADISAPGDADYQASIKADFVKAGYVPFNPEAYEAQYLGEVAGQTWFKTVYGNMGGDSEEKFASYKTELAGEKFTVGCDIGNGKFEGGSYGFGAVFTQIDASKDFTASVNIKIVTKGTGISNQSGFGMMVNDGIYIDTYDKTINSNCVVAGALVDKGAIFGYIDGSLKNNKANAVTIEEGSTFTATIVKAGTTYTVTLSDGTNTYTQEYTTADLCLNDANYVYLCLVANRGIVAEYSNVQITFAN